MPQYSEKDLFDAWNAAEVEPPAQPAIDFGGERQAQFDQYVGSLYDAWNEARRPSTFEDIWKAPGRGIGGGLTQFPSAFEAGYRREELKAIKEKTPEEKAAIRKGWKPAIPTMDPLVSAQLQAQGYGTEPMPEVEPEEVKKLSEEYDIEARKAIERTKKERDEAIQSLKNIFGEKRAGKGHVLEEAIYGVSSFTPTIAAHVVNPLAGTGVAWVQIFGGSMQDMEAQGVEFDRALEASIISASIQAPIESLGTLLEIRTIKGLARPFFSKRLPAEAVEDASEVFAKKFIKKYDIPKGKKTAALRGIGGIMKVSGTEGMEEYFQQWADITASVYAANPEMSWDDAVTEVKNNWRKYNREAIEAAWTGVVGGGLLAGLPGVVRTGTDISKYRKAKTLGVYDMLEGKETPEFEGEVKKAADAKQIINRASSELFAGEEELPYIPPLGPAIEPEAAGVGIPTVPEPYAAPIGVPEEMVPGPTVEPTRPPIGVPEEMVPTAEPEERPDVKVTPYKAPPTAPTLEMPDVEAPRVEAPEPAPTELAPGRMILEPSELAISKSPEAAAKLSPSQKLDLIDKLASQAETVITDKQRKTGKYRKGQVPGHLFGLEGIDISIENPRGSTRVGKLKAWFQKMKNHYGFIQRFKGADGDRVDVFLGNNPNSNKVFVVNQVNPKTKEFDEHKVMIGFSNEAQARAAYLANYKKGWKGLGSIKQMSTNEFMGWLKEEDKAEPAKPSLKDWRRDANLRKQYGATGRVADKKYVPAAKGKKEIAINKAIDRAYKVLVLREGRDFVTGEKGVRESEREFKKEPKIFRALEEFYQKKKYGDLIFTGDLVPLPESQYSEEQKALSDLVSKLGKKLYFFSTGNPILENIGGMRTDEYTLVNLKGTRPLMAVIGHEIWHDLSFEYPELANKFYDLAWNYVQWNNFVGFAEQRALFNDLVKGQVMEAEEFREEFIADFLGSLTIRKDFWEYIFSKDASLAEKLAFVVNKIISKVRNLTDKETRIYFKDMNRAQVVMAEVFSEYLRLKGVSLGELSKDQKGAMFPASTENIDLSELEEDDAGKESIKSAALKFNGKIYTGIDHAEAAMKLMDENNGEWPTFGDYEEGFMTNKDRFVDRDEAHDIAAARDQLTDPDDGKYAVSEDFKPDELKSETRESFDGLKFSLDGETDFSVNIGNRTGEPISAASYFDAAKAAGDNSRNILVKEKGAKTVLVQISSGSRSALAAATKNEYAAGDEYYDSIYENRAGYVRPADFWELPEWAGRAAYMLDKADVYVVRNVDEAIKFLNDSNYESVMFSVMDANKPIVKMIAQGYPGRILAGGYVDKKYFKDQQNVKWFDTLKDAAEELGVKYKEGVDYRHFKGTETVPRLELSRGCLHRCAFCTVPKKIRKASSKEISDQLKTLKNLDFKLVYINDKTFGQAGNYSKLADLNRKIRRQNKNFQGFIIQTTAPAFLKLDAKFLRESGIKYVELGVESYNNDILRKVNKPHTTELIDKAVDKIRQFNMKFIPNIIVGMAGVEKGNVWTETAETYQNTLDFLEENKDIISHSNVYVLATYEGTRTGDQLGTENESDTDENIISKTWLKDRAIHDKFYNDVIEFSKKQLAPEDEFPGIKVELRESLDPKFRLGDKRKDKLMQGLLAEMKRTDGPANLSIKGAILKSRGEWLFDWTDPPRWLTRVAIEKDFTFFKPKPAISRRIYFGPIDYKGWIQVDLAKKKRKALKALQGLFDEEIANAEEWLSEAKTGQEELEAGIKWFKEFRPNSYEDIEQWNDEDEMGGGKRKWWDLSLVNFGYGSLIESEVKESGEEVSNLIDIAEYKKQKEKAKKEKLKNFILLNKDYYQSLMAFYFRSGFEPGRAQTLAKADMEDIMNDRETILLNDLREAQDAEDNKFDKSRRSVTKIIRNAGGAKEVYKYLTGRGWDREDARKMQSIAKSTEQYPFPTVTKTVNAMLRYDKEDPDAKFWYEKTKWLDKVLENESDVDLLRWLSFLSHTSRNKGTLGNMVEFVKGRAIIKAGHKNWLKDSGLVPMEKIDQLFDAKSIDDMFNISEKAGWETGEVKVKAFAETFASIMRNNPEIRENLKTVVDIWMNRYFFPDRVNPNDINAPLALTPVMHDRIQDYMRVVEDRLTQKTGYKWTPDMAQANLWFLTRKMWKDAGVEEAQVGYTFDETLKILAGRWSGITDVDDEVVQAYIDMKLRDPDVRHILDHYTSKENDFTMAFPEYQGTGIATGQEWFKMDPDNPRPRRIHFYSAGRLPEPKLRKAKRMRTVVDSSRIYDMGADPDGYRQMFGTNIIGGKADPWAMSDMEKKIIKDGWIGLRSGDVTILFEPTRVHEMKRAVVSVSPIVEPEVLDVVKKTMPEQAGKLQMYRDMQENGDYEGLTDEMKTDMGLVLSHPLIDIRDITPADARWEGGNEFAIYADLDIGDMDILKGRIAEFLLNNAQMEGVISEVRSDVGQMKRPEGLPKQQAPSVIVKFKKALSEKELKRISDIMAANGIYGSSYLRDQDSLLLHHLMYRDENGKLIQNRNDFMKSAANFVAWLRMEFPGLTTDILIFGLSTVS